jgi:signal transduction protein with GAF and PtsI domain
MSANEFEFIDQELEEVDKIKFADLYEVLIPTMVNVPSMDWREESMLYPTELYLF